MSLSRVSLRSLSCLSLVCLARVSLRRLSCLSLVRLLGLSHVSLVCLFGVSHVSLAQGLSTHLAKATARAVPAEPLPGNAKRDSAAVTLSGAGGGVCCASLEAIFAAPDLNWGA